MLCAPGQALIGETEFESMREADCLLLDHLPADASAPPTAAAAPPTAAAAPPTAAAAPPTAAAAHNRLLRLSQLPARHKVLFGGLTNAADPAHCARQGIALACDGMKIDL